MTFEIRLATPDDGRAIAEVRKETWAHTYSPWIPDVVDNYDMDRATAMCAQWTREENGHVTVATEGGSVVAFCASGPANDDDAKGAGQVIAIYVKPDLHGKGIGGAMMKDALDWLAGSGYPECVLWVAEPGLRSRAFYEHVGFTKDEGATQPWRTITIVRYRRPLP